MAARSCAAVKLVGVWPQSLVGPEQVEAMLAATKIDQEKA